MQQPNSAPFGTFFGDSGRSMKRILQRDCNLVVWNRNFPEFLNWWISVLKWGNISELEFDLQIDQIDGFEVELRSIVDRWCTKSADFNTWFTSDVTELARQFISDTGAEKVLLRLCPLAQKSVDNVFSEAPLKLMCNYGGKGLQWSPILQGENLDENYINVQPLDILVLKGTNWPGRTLNCFGHRLNPDLKNEDGIVLEIEYLH